MRLRRRSAESAAPEDDATTAVEPDERAGPFDADDLPDDPDSPVARVDLGSLLVEPAEGRELRLQVDETSGQVQAVMLAAADGALELRAFAASRGGDLWGEVRPQIAADMTGRGGSVTEREGRFGTELVCRIDLRRPDGATGTQVSRVIGINGPRWMLRGTLIGRPAIDVDGAGEWEDLLARVVVRRGQGAVPPGEALPLVLPDSARRVRT